MTAVASVALVVPCYNEALRLDVRALREAELSGRNLELWLINDGCTDATLAMLRALERERPGRARVVSLDLRTPSGDGASAAHVHPAPRRGRGEKRHR